jgi:SNF2 family DNA or RNA helicase
VSEIIAVVEKGRIRVKSEFALAALAKSIPGGLWGGKTDKRWNYPATSSCASAIFYRYTNNGHEIACDRSFLELCAKAQDAADARSLKSRTDLPEIPGAFCKCDEPQRVEDVPFCVHCKKPFESWTHQRQAYHFAIAQDGALLSIGMGGGKSKITVSLLEGRDARKVLILCPNNVVPVWPKEFGKHAESEWRVSTGGHGDKTRNGTPKKISIPDRVERIKLDLSRGGRCVVAVNYEAAWQGALGEFLLSEEWDAIVLDESHRAKAPGGAASKFIARLRDRTPWRLCLTGTPQPHSPLDIYAQARFIDPGVFGTNFAKFRKRYAVLEDTYVKGGGTVPTVVGFQNEGELAEKIASFSFIIEQDELDAYLGLPETLDVQRECRLGAKAQKVYNEIWNEFAVSIDEGTVSASNVLTRLLRVQQITSGHLPLDGEGDSEREVVEIDDSKKKLLADVFANEIPADAPRVVFARFTHDLNSIREVAENAGLRYGELSGRDKGGMTDEATMRDDVDVLGVQIQAGGVGIDLTRAAYAIYYSLGFSLGDYLQSRKRVHRPGQSRKTHFMHLIASGTVDEIVYATLAERQEIVDAVIKMAKGS